MSSTKVLTVAGLVLVVCWAGAVFGQQQLVLSQYCLGCLCHASSLCNETASCSGDICGPFQMTWGYWSDGGKPVASSGESPDSPGAYANCANNLVCSSLAVQGYMQKFQQDCNGDGNIDCDDFLFIHKLGGYGCRGGGLPEWYTQRYAQCKQHAGGNL